MKVYLVCGWWNDGGGGDDVIFMSVFDNEQKANDFIKTDPVLEEDKDLFKRYDRYSVQEFEVI